MQLDPLRALVCLDELVARAAPEGAKPVHVEPVGIVEPAGDRGDGDDARAELRQEARDLRPDLAEALDGDGRVREVEAGVGGPLPCRGEDRRRSREAAVAIRVHLRRRRGEVVLGASPRAANCARSQGPDICSLVSQAAFDDLRQRLAEIRDLWKTAALLSWDQQVMMPSGGAAIRAEQLATVGRIAHTKFISAEIGRLIDDLRDFGEQHEYDSFEASLIRVARRDWEKASKVPPDLRAEMSRSAALANPVWVAARRDNDFASFLPVLRKNLDLRKRYIDCFEVGDEPYDIVLDDYERGMKTAEVRRIFDYLKEHQAPLVKEVAEQSQVEKREKTFDIDAQKIFELEVVREFGFTADAWRLDPTVHPFASGTGVTDIRITTRYFTDGLEGLFGTMHEFGHGLYEHQVDPSLERSPLARGVSLGLHESQSRMSENLVGRSQPFWRRFFPRAQELFATRSTGTTPRAGIAR